MHDTQNDLKSTAKQVSINILNARLADAIDLALLTKQAHWNIKGPQFIALHEMIDSFRTEIDGHVDTMAERVVQLGGTALGTTQAVGKATTLAPYPTDIYKSSAHLAALIEQAASDTIQVVCAEQLRWSGYRSLIVDALVVHGTVPRKDRQSVV